MSTENAEDQALVEHGFMCLPLVPFAFRRSTLIARLIGWLRPMRVFVITEITTNEMFVKPINDD